MDSPKSISADWRFTVRTKLGLHVTLLIAGIAAFILLYFPGQLEREAMRAMEEKANSMARMAAYSSASGLDFEDVDAVRDALEGVRQNPDFVYAIVRDQSGRIFASMGEHSGLDEDWNVGVAADVRDDDLLRVEVPILAFGREIGRLSLGLSLENVRKQVTESRTSVLLLTLAVFVTGMIAVLGISAVIMGPLSEISRTAEAISNGDLSRRVWIASRDEFGVLGTAFNVMLEHVEDRTLALESEVSDRRLAEEALQHSEKRLAFILAASPAIIYTCRYDGSKAPEPTFVSRNVREVLGYEPEECLGDPMWWSKGLHPKDFSRTQENASHLTKDGRVTHEYRFRHKDGSYRWIQDTVRLVLDVSGRPEEMIGSWVDVTDRKDLEFEALAAQEELEAQRAGSMRSDRLRSLGEMAAGIAHELN